MSKNFSLALFPKAVFAEARSFQKLRCTIAICVLSTLFGFVLTQWVCCEKWRVFGLGLMLPGGGFLTSFSSLSLCLFGGALASFWLSLILWFATGNALAPPMTWLLLAVLAVCLPQGPVNAVAGQKLLEVLLVVGAVGALTAILKFRIGVHNRRRANQILANPAEYCWQERGSANAPEFSLNELRQMRFLLDRALQPLERFEGFEWIDQFQTAAVRYQINFTGYALAMAQATRLPALGSYLDEAQLRLIRKQTDHRLWKYWALENLWGNLCRNPDPVARQNIMYSGFCATQMALFHAASGRRDFDAAGSFTLQHPAGQHFAYDYPAIVEILRREYQHSDLTLVACEPNWVYPLCNAITVAAIKARDAQAGGERWMLLEAAFRQSLESDFIDADGRFIPCRSAYTGLALPTMGGAMPQAMASFFLNATMPDIAARQWLLLRRQLIERRGGVVSLRRRAFWPIDTGNYRFSRAAALAATAVSAVEMGDQEIAQMCLAALDFECPGISEQGGFYRPQASVWAHAVEFFALAGWRNGFRNLIEKPHQQGRNWPHIAEASYPQVLVACAVHDAQSLQATLYPGEAALRCELGLAGLEPGVRYHCDGVEEREIQASPQGKATIHVTLDGRKEIRIYWK